MARHRMADDMVKLIRVIEEVGPRNLSLIAKLTGIPERTVRYRVKEQLPALGFTFRPLVDEGKLGLIKYFIRLRFSGGLREEESIAVLDALARTAYLTYYAGLMPCDEFIALASVPFGLEERWRRLFSTLANVGILDSFALYPLDEVWRTSIDISCFDFAHGTWSLNFGSSNGASGDRSTVLRRPDPEMYDVDKVDLLIIKELQKDPLQPFTEMAKAVGVNEAVLRYHYKEHVLGRELIPRYMVVWHSRGSFLRGEYLGTVLMCNDVDEGLLVRITDALARFPFTRFEGVSLEHVFYVLMLEMPAPWLTRALRLLREAGVPSTMQMSFIDVTRMRHYTIPYEMFDDETGWTFDEEKVMDIVARAASLEFREAVMT